MKQCTRSFVCGDDRVTVIANGFMHNLASIFQSDESHSRFSKSHAMLKAPRAELVLAGDTFQSPSKEDRSKRAFREIIPRLRGGTMTKPTKAAAALVTKAKPEGLAQAVADLVAAKIK